MRLRERCWDHWCTGKWPHPVPATHYLEATGLFIIHALLEVQLPTSTVHCQGHVETGLTSFLLSLWAVPRQTHSSLTKTLRASVPRTETRHNKPVSESGFLPQPRLFSPPPPAFVTRLCTTEFECRVELLIKTACRFLNVKQHMTISGYKISGKQMCGSCTGCRGKPGCPLKASPFSRSPGVLKLMMVIRLLFRAAKICITGFSWA